LVKIGPLAYEKQVLESRSLKNIFKKLRKNIRKIYSLLAGLPNGLNYML